MYQNICVEPHPSQYQNGFEILSCPDIYPVCEYNTEYEGNIEPFECQVSTTLYFENLKYQCKTSEEACIEHDLGQVSSRFCRKCANGFFIKNGYCMECGENCNECTDIGSCVKCADGYLLADGECKSQGSMKCSKVDERTKCYECEETFAFNEKGACVVNEDKSC